jgi:nitroreductase
MDRATVDDLLTTTRTVRRRLDLSNPVEPAVIQECLELAIQAPNGGNQDRYHFVVVTDPTKRAAIGVIYKRVFYQEHVNLSGAGDPGLPVYQQRSETIGDSARYLADHLGEVPAHYPVRRDSIRDRGHISAGHPVWKHPACGVVPDAGAALARPRHGMDDPASLPRARGGRASRDSRRCHPGGAPRCGPLHRD